MTIDTHRVAELVEMIKPILAGELAEVQGAVLADCLATWLASHVIYDSPGRTRQMRESLLALHVEALKPLIAANARIMGLPH